MKNTEENRKIVTRRQFAKYNKFCYLLCKCCNDGSEELFELPMDNYSVAAKETADNFKSHHSGFCICTINVGNGIKGKCISI